MIVNKLMSLISVFTEDSLIRQKILGSLFMRKSDDETFLDTRDLQPELYVIEERERVIFDEFSAYEKSVEKFKKSLSFFSDTNNENSFFDAVIYGLMFKLTEGKIVSRNKVKSVLEAEFYKDFCEVKDQLHLDTSMYGFFDKCVLANEFLTKKFFFLKFYERRDKCRYLTKKGACSENKITRTRDLSSFVIENFNG